MTIVQLHIILTRLALVLPMLIGIQMSASSQDAALKKELMELFEDQSQEVWVTAYDGLENYIFPFVFVMAHSDDQYHAMLQYPDSEARFYYSGDYEGAFPESMIELTEVAKPTGCMLHLQVQDDCLSGYMDIDPESDFDLVPIVLRKQRGAEQNFPAAASILAAGYHGDFLGEEAFVKIYVGEYDIKMKVEHTNELLHLQNDRQLHGKKYAISSSQAAKLSNLISDISVEVKADQLIFRYLLDGKSKIDKLTIGERMVRDLEVFNTPSAKVCISTPLLESKKFERWKSEQVAKVSKDVTTLKQKVEDHSYGTCDRYSEQIGVDVRISYFDKRYISGDAFIHGYTNSMTSPYIYDRVKDQMLTSLDIIDNANIPAEIKQFIHPSHNLVLTESGLAFESDYDAVYGSQKYYVPFADAVGQYQAMISSRSFRNHFLKQ